MDRRPRRRRHGDAAELIARRYLAGLGWTELDSNVRVGRDEIDIIAVEPGADACLVFVEVRSNVTGRFGAPEESVVGAKIRRTYRAAAALVRAGALPEGAILPRVRWRVDLIAVERRPWLGRGIGGPAIRHFRGIPPD